MCAMDHPLGTKLAPAWTVSSPIAVAAYFPELDWARQPLVISPVSLRVRWTAVEAFRPLPNRWMKARAVLNLAPVLPLTYQHFPAGSANGQLLGVASALRTKPEHSSGNAVRPITGSSAAMRQGHALPNSQRSKLSTATSRHGARAAFSSHHLSHSRLAKLNAL